LDFSFAFLAFPGIIFFAAFLTAALADLTIDLFFDFLAMVFPFDFLAVFLIAFFLVCLAFFEAVLEPLGAAFFDFLTAFATALTGADLAARFLHATDHRLCRRVSKHGDRAYH
jgi:hypothetical protein